jgi:sorting and assembly machinery component 37
LRKKALQHLILLLPGLNNHRFSSFLESRGQPILDLSLYVSSENYTTCTRKAYSEILLWPNVWITPPKLRAVAKKRSQHLGLSSLDINTAHEEVTEESKLTAQIPKSLRKPKETVSSLLGKSTHRNQFRLDAVTSEFFESLDDLADKGWLISDTVTSVDCLAIGYLTLMHTPQLPHDWLRSAMKKKYPKLGKWTAQVARSTFGDPIDPSHALSPLPKGNRQGGRGLPWQAPVRPTVTAIALSLLDDTLDALPIVSQLRANKQLRKSSQEDPELEDYERKQLAVMATNRNRELYSQVFTIGAGIGMFAGYLFWVGILQLPRRWSRDNGRRNFGAAGAMLGLG